MRKISNITAASDKKNSINIIWYSFICYTLRLIWLLSHKNKLIFNQRVYNLFGFCPVNKEIGTLGYSTISTGVGLVP